MSTTNTAIQLLQQFGLATSGSFNYSEEANAFLGNGYTSNAGNTYFNSLRFIEGISVKEDIGQGYAHSFLNGIRIYAMKDKQLLCERSYHCRFYSQATVQHEVIEMLSFMLLQEAISQGVKLNATDIKRSVTDIVTKSIQQDQRQALSNEVKRSLTA